MLLIAFTSQCTHNHLTKSGKVGPILTTMHPRMFLVQLLWASLAAAYAVKPAGSSESIDVFSDYDDTDVHLQHVQMLYDSLGGTITFPTGGK